jgi:hypothetical protein
MFVGKTRRYLQTLDLAGKALQGHKHSSLLRTLVITELKSLTLVHITRFYE